MKRLSTILLFASMSFGIFAQHDNQKSSSGSAETVESQVILSLSKSTARSSEELAIDFLEKMDPSAIDGSENLKEALRYLTNYSFSFVVRDSNKGMKVNYSDIRRRAVHLLSKLGSDDAKKMIKTVLSYDTDVTVLAEAAYATGLMGDPADDLTIEILMRAITFSKSLRNVDNNLMYACLIALDKLSDKGSFSDKSNKLISEAMLDILTISGDNVKGPTRKKAMDVINKLKKQ